MPQLNWQPFFPFWGRRITRTPSPHPSLHTSNLERNFLLTSSLPKWLPALSQFNTKGMVALREGRHWPSSQAPRHSYYAISDKNPYSFIIRLLIDIRFLPSLLLSPPLITPSSVFTGTRVSLPSSHSSSSIFTPFSSAAKRKRVSSLRFSVGWVADVEGKLTSIPIRRVSPLWLYS